MLWLQGAPCSREESRLVVGDDVALGDGVVLVTKESNLLLILVVGEERAVGRELLSLALGSGCGSASGSSSSTSGGSVGSGNGTWNVLVNWPRHGGIVV